jgi:hypothetical protein
MATKEQCLEWVKNPRIDPITGESMVENKSQFMLLLNMCKTKLTPIDVSKANGEMTQIIFPQNGSARSIVMENEDADEDDEDDEDDDDMKGIETDEIKINYDQLIEDNEEEEDAAQEGGNKGIKINYDQLIEDNEEDAAQAGEDEVQEDEVQRGGYGGIKINYDQLIEDNEEEEEVQEDEVQRGGYGGMKINYDQLIEDNEEGTQDGGVRDKLENDGDTEQMDEKKEPVEMDEPVEKTCTKTINPSYSTNKLTEEQHVQYIQLVYDEQISHGDMIKMINDDQFIKGIIMSEGIIASKKGLSAPSDDVKSKRSKLLKVIDDSQKILCKSRAFIRQIIYQKIVYFSKSPNLSMINVVLGKIGTGKKKIVQLFADLFCALGMINTNTITNVLSPDNLETMICLDNEDEVDTKFVADSAVNLAITFTGAKSDLAQDIIYLTDYDGDDLSIILHEIIGTAFKTEYVLDLISHNYKLFTDQAKDMESLARYLINDNILVTSQNEDYDQSRIDNTVRKFFIHRGKFVTLNQNGKHTDIVPTKIFEITWNLKDILMSNLLDRTMVIKLIQSDKFINDVINAKQASLKKRGTQSPPSQSLEAVRKSLDDMISTIDNITGESRENIRRMLYSQICLLSHEDETLMNCVVLGSDCSEKSQVIKAVSKICEHLCFSMQKDNVQENHVTEQDIRIATQMGTLKYIDLHVGMCGIILNSNDIQTSIPFNHLFSNYLFILPYTSNDLFEILLKSIKMSDMNITYIKRLVELLNKDPDLLFDEQACDMRRLAKYIEYDATIHGDNYGTDEIHKSFQKFFYSKGIYVDLSIETVDRGRKSINKVMLDIKKLRSQFFK